MDGSILTLPGKLDRLLHHGCNLPKGATDEILLIKGDLEKIIAITSNLENHHAMKARCWRKEVRELSYDLEDFVDQYEHAVQRIQRWGGRYSSPPYRRLVQEGAPKPTLQLCPWMKEWKLVSNKKERNKRMGERTNKIKSKAALPWLWEKLRLRLWMANGIREFSVRVQEALQRHSSYNLDTIDGSSSTGCTDAYCASGKSTYNEENTYVGIGAALEKLEELLMAKHDDRHQKLKTVSIVGFGGIGKTTLATELYRKFGLQFECRAFVRTAQKPDVRRIFISMLSQVRPHQPPDNWTVHGLISTIRTHLQDKRYLIIVEDLSATSTWDIVKCALPDSNYCSRILTTTEIEDLALQCCGHDPKHVYKMEPLGEENSRELFFSSVFGPQHECPPELKEISYDIISKCGGLPLAIVTVASILSSQLATQDQWHYVNNSIGYNLLANHSLEGMKQVLDLSYNNLPHHLKACILYTCLYEEDIIIYRDDLVNQWIAEGFIQATEGQDKKEIARSFFDRLISAKLILPVDINRNGEVLSCTVHHMVLNLVTRYKSTEENFVTAIHHSQAPTTIADNVRRLSLQFGNAADAKAPVNVTLTHVKTLAIWGVFKCLPSVVQFPLLQVLILHFWGNKDGISFDITGISELFRLRYLKVTSNVILKLCTKMRSMQSLETLTIDARVSAVPSDIVHLPGLLHLSLPDAMDLPNGIGNLTSLQMLGYFDLSSNSMENVQSLRMLTNIEDLQLTCSILEPDNLREKMHFVIYSVFVTLRNLKSLTMVPRASSYAKSIDDAGAVGMAISIDDTELVELPSAPALLRWLEVSPRICRFFCLPKWIGQLKKLRVLKFGVRKIDRDGVDILGGLPDLAVLSLYVHMKPEMGILIGKTGFPVIKCFKLMCCDPCLKFEEGAMPNLRKLKITFNACNAGQQNTIPVGINYLSKLKEVSAKIGGAGPEESHTRAAKLAFRDAIRMHDRIQRVNIQCVNQIIFGNDDQSNITPVEDSERSGEETMHFQNESKQIMEEDTREAVDVCESSHCAMGLYELSDSGCGSNSEDICQEVPQSSIRSAHFGSSPAKKGVLKVDLQDNKDRQKVFKAVSTLHGIDSASMDMKDSKVTAVGKVDPVNVVAKLRKVGSTAITSMRQWISNRRLLAGTSCWHSNWPREESQGGQEITAYTNALVVSVNILAIEKRLQKLSFNDLIVATNGFHNDSLIGSGGFGDVYKAQLKDGMVVAIKKLIHVSVQDGQEFTAEMEFIGRAIHRNLVPLLGYCKCGEEWLLVYDYMTFGSLEDVLHDRKKVGVKLNWAARKKIAIGAARGLAYLHHVCIPHIIHRDMKSSNVLIDEQLEARVSDFGMARMMSVSTLAGTPGYVPPEYYQSFRCTTKGDVYSYGVVLLELLTGKPPTDSTDFGEDNNLVGWVRQYSKQKLTDVFDPELVKEDPALELELLEHLKIAYACLDDRPSKRPTMLKVVEIFKELHGSSAVDS